MLTNHSSYVVTKVTKLTNAAKLLSGCVLFLSGLGYQPTIQAQVSMDYMMLRLATEFNDAKAQYLLGKKYYLGTKVEQNYDEAIKWFEKAAAQNNVDAIYYLGKMNLHGEGIPHNYPAAFDFLSKAVDRRHIAAKYELANMLFEKKFGRQNIERALELYKQAAKERFAQAAYKLGVIYYEGSHVPANPDMGKKWLLAAAESGDSPAQKYLKKTAAKQRKLVAQNSTPAHNDKRENAKQQATKQQPVTQAASQKTQAKAEPTKTQTNPKNPNGKQDVKTDSAPTNALLATLLEKAKSGDVDAQYASGMSYLSGEHGSKNPLNSVQWFRKAAEQNHAGAQYKLGLLYRDGTGVAQSDSEAIKWLRLASSWGVAQARKDLETLLRKQLIADANTFAGGPLAKPEAQFTLGMMYVNGDGVAKDPSAAAQWLHKAAEQDHTEAQFQLGQLYNSGSGVEADKQAAKMWLAKAADAGLTKADNALQTMLKKEEKRLIKRDVNTLKKSPVYTLIQNASEGDTESQYVLGIKYSKGDGTEKSIEKALHWLQLAAEDEHMMAQLSLGEIFLNGLEVEKNLPMAAKWYKKAAEQGNSEAQYNLGNLYRRGEGVSMSNTKAVKWYRMAARQGHSKAKNRLGGCRIC
ncbi:MAG: hypothetical protein OEZ68_11505 [Gammaproteobacteria bacterium]|nr:hypothetical protein [Gammaproteobacteria bacterium]MDH5801419.1 hypothetical protein [Gammaproteobacteria bacterium]